MLSPRNRITFCELPKKAAERFGADAEAQPTVNNIAKASRQRGRPEKNPFCICSPLPNKKLLAPMDFKKAKKSPPCTGAVLSKSTGLGGECGGGYRRD